MSITATLAANVVSQEETKKSFPAENYVPLTKIDRFKKVALEVSVFFAIGGISDLKSNVERGSIIAARMMEGKETSFNSRELPVIPMLGLGAVSIGFYVLAKLLPKTPTEKKIIEDFNKRNDDLKKEQDEDLAQPTPWKEISEGIRQGVITSVLIGGGIGIAMTLLSTVQTAGEYGIRNLFDRCIVRVDTSPYCEKDCYLESCYEGEVCTDLGNDLQDLALASLILLAGAATVVYGPSLVSRVKNLFVKPNPETAVAA